MLRFPVLAICYVDSLNKNRMSHFATDTTDYHVQIQEDGLTNGPLR